MPNQSGPWPVRGMMREGAQVSAEEMKRIIDSLSQRIVGDGKTIFVRTWPGGQICIEGVDKRGGGYVPPPAPVEPTVPMVMALPPIPTSGMKEVYWIPDGQVWRAYQGQSSWYPTQFSTTRSGV